MGPGRSPGRLRSKTADFSDMLRGNPKQPSDNAIPPMPTVLPTAENTTPKSRRKLTGFLGLKRKSAGITLGLEPGARELKDGIWRTEDSAPAVPDDLLNSRISASEASSGSSLPSSLPPLNVSPPSFGGHFAQASTTPTKSRSSGINQQPSETDRQNASSSNATPYRALRTQKSVSFEVSRPFNVAHNATASAMPSMLDKTKKPVITISAPPGVEDDANLFNAPRNPPPPPPSSSPSKSSSGQGHSRRALGFSFGHHRKDEVKEKERVISSPIAGEPLTPVQNRYAASAGDQPSPTPSLSPLLPPSMRFPVPPTQAGSAANGDQSADKGDETLTGAFQTHSPSSTLSPTVSPHTATPSDLADRSPTPKPTRTPARPARPTSLILPSPTTRRSPPSAPPKVPASPSSANSKQSAASLKIRSRRSSRSPSPASPPPNDPLPSPPTSATFPSSDTEGWTTDASTTIGGWTTDASSRMGSVGTIPSLASRRSVASAARLRANTIAVVNSSKLANTGTVSSGDEMDRVKTRNSRAADLSHCIPSVLSGRHSDRKEERDRAKERIRADTIVAPSRSQTSQSNGEVTPTRDETPGQSLRAAHETFVRMLREKHAAEKAELLKRIERLEKEARRREREIKGLRWLVMNANSENGGAGMLSMEDQLVIGRLRSGSKASDLSAVSSGRSRSSSVMHTAPGEQDGKHSPANSVEEGLRDLQDTVGDLIAPNRAAQTSESGPRPDSPPGGAALKRSNTMPDGYATSMAKQSRRSSSPVPAVPSRPSAPGGLGFDIPTIPGSQSDMSLSTADSLPSLSSTSTASSTLSVIPEVASLHSDTDSLRAAKDKEQRRASKVLKRISGSPSVHASYAANLKIGMSPSIEQVLDRTRDAEPGGMDDVLRKLRAFSSSA